MNPIPPQLAPLATGWVPHWGLMQHDGQTFQMEALWVHPYHRSQPNDPNRCGGRYVYQVSAELDGITRYYDQNMQVLKEEPTNLDKASLDDLKEYLRADYAVPLVKWVHAPRGRLTPTRELIGYFDMPIFNREYVR